MRRMEEIIINKILSILIIVYTLYKALYKILYIIFEFLYEKQKQKLIKLQMNECFEMESLQKKVNKLHNEGGTEKAFDMVNKYFQKRR